MRMPPRALAFCFHFLTWRRLEEESPSPRQAESTARGSSCTSSSFHLRRSRMQSLRDCVISYTFLYVHTSARMYPDTLVCELYKWNYTNEIVGSNRYYLFMKSTGHACNPCYILRNLAIHCSIYYILVFVCYSNRGVRCLNVTDCINVGSFSICLRYRS